MRGIARFTRWIGWRGGESIGGRAPLVETALDMGLPFGEALHCILERAPVRIRRCPIRSPVFVHASEHPGERETRREHGNNNGAGRA